MNRTFWHQHFRTTLEGLSGALTHSILQFPKSGLSTRYTKLLLAFIISGCMHVGHDVGGAVEARGGAMRFFCTQYVGVVIEDAVQALSRRGGPGKGGDERSKGEEGKGNRGQAWWKRWVGRVWVATFLVWSTPTFQYPVLLVKRRTGDEMLALSIANSSQWEARIWGMK